MTYFPSIGLALLQAQDQLLQRMEYEVQLHLLARFFGSPFGGSSECAWTPKLSDADGAYIMKPVSNCCCP